MIINKRLIQQINTRAHQYGLRIAISEFLKDLRINQITTIGNTPTNGPLLIISNHTGILDSPLLLSRVERGDFYLVALSMYKIFGPKLSERLLPIYRSSQFVHKLVESLIHLQITGQIPKELTSEEIKTKNQKTIGQAAQLLNKGAAVAIFPTGGAGKQLANSNWKIGVGFLVKQVSNPNTKVVFAHIKGTNYSDLVAYLHPFLRNLLFRPRPISIRFSKAGLLSSLIGKETDAKQIVSKLEKESRSEWV